MLQIRRHIIIVKIGNNLIINSTDKNFPPPIKQLKLKTILVVNDVLAEYKQKAASSTEL
jgi:hypothetical protein